MNVIDPDAIASSRGFDVMLFRMSLGLLQPLLKEGRLRVHYKDSHVTLGKGSEPVLEARFTSLQALFRIITDSDLAVGETYVEGGWDADAERLADILDLLLINQQWLQNHFPLRALVAIRKRLEHLRPNTVARSSRNAAHHYDIGNDLYARFLDADMVYSCGFFTPEAQSLEAAQRNKLDTSLERLGVSAGHEVLDIGCGWGAMTRAIARRQAKATGITLSRQQYSLACENLPEEFSGEIEYKLQDYRDHAAENAGRYDRIISVGMFEHVGEANFQRYFEAVRDLLKPGGRALIHSIIKHSRDTTNAWISKYIFPGGFIPRVEDIASAAQQAGLKLVRTPYIHEGEQYAETLRHWFQRFNEAWPELDHDKYDDRFRRIWNFYLSGSQASFRKLGNQVAQLPLEK